MLVASIEFLITFSGPEKSTRLSDLVCCLKCFRSYSEALETLNSLLA